MNLYLKKNTWNIILGITIFIIVWELLGIFEYVNQSAKYMDNQLIPSNVDMIVVLTGGAKRIPEAYRLMKEHNIDHLLISGVSHEVRYEDIAKQYDWDDKYKSRIILDYEPKTTYQNAKMTASYVAEFQATRIVLVTSIYHIKRSMFLINEALNNQEIDIIPFSVYSAPLDIYNWWNSKACGVLIQEYVKYRFHYLKKILF